MYCTTKIGNTSNIPVKTIYCESEEELVEIDSKENIPVSSMAMILTETGLTVKMKHSNGDWITV